MSFSKLYYNRVDFDIQGNTLTVTLYIKTPIEATRQTSIFEYVAPSTEFDFNQRVEIGDLTLYVAAHSDTKQLRISVNPIESDWWKMGLTTK